MGFKKIKIFVFSLLLFSCNKNMLQEKIILKSKIESDSLIVKEVHGDYLSGGILVIKKDRNESIKIGIIDDRYDKAEFLGLSKNRDSIILNFKAYDTYKVKKATLIRSDTIMLKWK